MVGFVTGYPDSSPNVHHEQISTAHNSKPGAVSQKKTAALLEPRPGTETPSIFQLPKIPTQTSLWSVGQGLVLVVWCFFGGSGLLSWQSLVREALQQRKT